MQRRSLLILAAIVAGITVSAQAQPSVERLDIEPSRSSRLMPYQLDTLWCWGYDGKVRHRGITVLSSANATTDTAYLAIAFNVPVGLDLPSGVNTMRFPPFTGYLYDEQPVSMVISDITTYTDAASGRELILIGGRRNDSAFVMTIDPYSEVTQSCYIGSGEDRTDNGWWNGGPHVVLVDDLDGDGRQEAYVSIMVGRDGNGSGVAAVDLSDLSLRWKYPLPVEVATLLPVRSSGQASLLCLTQSSGYSDGDSLFTDTFSYLLSLSPAGQLRWYRTVGAYPQGAILSAGPNDSTVLLVHEVPWDTDVTSLDDRQAVCHISLIGQSGNLLADSRDTVQIRTVWTMDRDRDGSDEIYSINRLGIIRQYDGNLDCAAESGPTVLHEYHDYLPRVLDDRGLIYAKTVNERYVILDDQFNWLADAPGLGSQLQQMSTDRLEQRPVIVGSASSTGGVALQLNRRDWLDILGIYYNDFREFMLAALFSLVAGILVMAVYRRRDKLSLRTIAAQKAEIERSHAALQEAQQKIIAAEKYRQAKDIAGGFAHEIRNALFPAKSRLYRLKNTAPSSADAHAAIERAIDRAIASTRIISTYAQLDDAQSRRDIAVRSLIDESLAALNDLFTANAIEVVIDDATDGTHVRANEDQLRLVFDNVLRNAVDALTGRGKRCIFVTIAHHEQAVLIRFEDTGPGFSRDAKERAFDAFFTTKPDRGTGLGLTIAQKVVQAHNGTIAVDDGCDSGAIDIRLPSV